MGEPRGSAGFPHSLEKADCAPPQLLRSAHSGSTPECNSTAHQSLGGLEKQLHCSAICRSLDAASCNCSDTLMMLNGTSWQFFENATGTVQNMRLRRKLTSIKSHSVTCGRSGPCTLVDLRRLVFLYVSSLNKNALPKTNINGWRGGLITNSHPPSRI